MESRGGPDYRRKTSHSSPIGSFAGCDKAPPQIALNWRARRDQALYRTISADDFPSTAFYLSKANYLEVTAKNVSKEDALVELANYYHLSLEEVLTMGDNFNDLPMLKKQASGVAMGNAPQEVKDGATVVTKPTMKNGAGQAVETYVLI